jgi:hypothetical protein
VDTPDIKNFIFVSFFSSWFIPLWGYDNKTSSRVLSGKS